MDGSSQREATLPPRSIKWILGKRRQGCELWLNFPPRQVSGSFRPSIRHTTYTYYMHVESKPSSEVCQVLLPSKGPQLVSVIGSSILECHFSPRFGHLLDSYKWGQLLPLVTPTNIQRLWVIWGQCCLRAAAGHGLPNGSITQLSPYLTRNPCTLSKLYSHYPLIYCTLLQFTHMFVQ